MEAASIPETPTAAPKRNPVAAWLSENILWVLLGLALVYYFVQDPTQTLDDVKTGLSNGTIWALIALGYTLVYGIIELINFAHGEGFILQNVGLLWRPTPDAVPDLIQSQADYFTIFDVPLEHSDVFAVIVTVPLLVALVWFVGSTRYGKAMRATAQDPDAARLMGIDVDRTISLTFMLGGLLAGAAGMIYALYNGTIQFNQGFTAGLIAFTAAVMGGIGNLKGAVVGGLIIGVIQSISDTHFSQVWTPAIVFAILILVMVFRPQGLFGEETREG
jgi:branched-chain amino acid transport system permease protein